MQNSDILEDDCVPHVDFFPYCAILLEKYRYNPQVMAISGTNPFDDLFSEYPYSYGFTRWIFIWGWATWKRAWIQYDINLPKWKEWSKLIQSSPTLENFPQFKEKILYVGDFLYNNRKNPDTWDWQWAITIFALNRLCIYPKVNLISNIGEIGAHFTGEDSPHLFRPTNELSIDALPQPTAICENRGYDETFFKSEGEDKYKSFKIASLLGEFLRKLHIFPKLNVIHPIHLLYCLLTIKKYK